MKNRLYIVLCFLFLFGGPSIDAGELGGIGGAVIVQGKNMGAGVLVTPPSEYLGPNGNLNTSISLSLSSTQTGIIVFSKNTFDKLTILPNLKQGEYILSLTIGSFYFQEEIIL